VAPKSPEQGKRGERIELVSQESEKNRCAAGMARGGKVSCLRRARVWEAKRLEKYAAKQKLARDGMTRSVW
jgi:hypothetical protein